MSGLQTKAKKNLTVSAPPPYSDAADHLIACSSSGVMSVLAAIRSVVYEETAVPDALKIKT